MGDKDIGFRQPPPPINIVNFDEYRINNSSSLQEIVEDDDGGMPSITEEYDSSGLFSYDDRNGSDIVYVVTSGGSEEVSSASMDALVWTLANDLNESTIIYLVHVYPELRYIPTPLGKLPISQANPEQKEGYLVEERRKRSDYLQTFLSLCSSSKVQAETVLIESDMEAKAILDLIPILNIRRLVLGATKSTLRRLAKKGSGTVDQILHNAPDFCEVKIICEGKQVLTALESPVPSPSPSPRTLQPQTMQNDTNSVARCGCFKL